MQTSGPVAISAPGELTLGGYKLVLGAPRAVEEYPGAWINTFTDSSCAWFTTIFEIDVSVVMPDGTTLQGAPLRWVATHSGSYVEPNTSHWADSAALTVFGPDLQVGGAGTIHSTYPSGWCGSSYIPADPSPVAPAMVSLEFTAPEPAVAAPAEFPPPEATVFVQEGVAAPTGSTELAAVATSVDETPASVVSTPDPVPNPEVVAVAQQVGYDQQMTASLPTSPKIPGWAGPVALVGVAGLIGWAVLRRR